MTADAAFARIAAVSGERIDPPTLLPARIILELSGEAVRARLCTFTDATGEEIALRPDLTTPIAAQAAAGELPLQRYHYSGRAYRLALPGADERTEFRQIGFEWFGGGGAKEDAEAAALTAEAAAAGGVREADASLRFGDVAVFHAVVDALDFSPRWRQSLKRAFARRKGPRELLSSERSGPPPLAASLAALSPADAERAVEEIFALTGAQPVARTAGEIAERLRDLAGDVAPSPAAAKLLGTYLAIDAPVAGCIAALEAFAKSAKVDLGPALAALSQRLDLLRSAPFWGKARFSAEAGRRFEYYDGFVFELAATADRPIASGGRYDGLIAKLSGGKLAAPAIGAALRADRLNEGAAA